MKEKYWEFFVTILAVLCMVICQISVSWLTGAPTLVGLYVTSDSDEMDNTG